MISVHQVVWVALLLLVTTSQGQWLKEIQSAIKNQLNTQQSTQLPALPWNATCPCCHSNCTWNGHRALLSCSTVLSFSDYPANCSRLIEHLEIVNGLFQSTSLAALPPLPSLRRLSIVGCQRLVHVDYLPPSLPLLTHLDIANNSLLTRFDAHLWPVLQTARNLTHLNLANNHLHVIDGDFLPVLENLDTLRLSGNRWNCENDFQWILAFQSQGILQDGEQLSCQDSSKRNSWLDWTYSILKREKNKKIVAAECHQRTPQCHCRLQEGRTSYTVQVDCSRRNLTILPDTLPAFTKELDVQGNQLSDLDHVTRYESPHLKILIADSNQIRSIRNLSSTIFMRNFNRFSLQHNHIPSSEIPWQQLTVVSSQFEQKYLYLYNNSWNCTCELATTVRDWLWKNRHIVSDASLLFCSNYGKNIPVLNLLPNVMCSDVYDESDPEEDANARTWYTLNTIIGFEMFFIVTVAAKFSYDAWHYIRHGKLPWIAAKIM